MHYSSDALSLLIFLVQVFIISLSGALQPGPVTATALAIGSRNRYAGLELALGHAIIELPLMIIITMGIGRILESVRIQMAIGFAGGLLLLIMAVQMWITAAKTNAAAAEPRTDRPILAGLVLTVGNPYFLLWWATIGLKLATDAKEFGIWAFPLFAIVHWLCDGMWLHVLSWTSFKGARLLGPKSQKITLWICGAAMLLFAGKFILDAVRALLEMAGS
jgi:threonine/homoserine/homoserine lactone efflux protein